MQRLIRCTPHRRVLLRCIGHQERLYRLQILVAIEAVLGSRQFRSSACRFEESKGTSEEGQHESQDLLKQSSETNSGVNKTDTGSASTSTSSVINASKDQQSVEKLQTSNEKTETLRPEDSKPASSASKDSQNAEKAAKGTEKGKEKSQFAALMNQSLKTAPNSDTTKGNSKSEGSKSKPSPPPKAGAPPPKSNAKARPDSSNNKRPGRGSDRRSASPPPPSTSVWVFNLPLTLNKNADFKTEFEEFGEVAKAKLWYDGPSGNPVGRGLIEFSNVDNAKKAVEASKSRKKVIGEQRVKIEFAKAPMEKAKEKKGENAMPLSQKEQPTKNAVAKPSTKPASEMKEKPEGRNVGKNEDNAITKVSQANQDLVPLLLVRNLAPNTPPKDLRTFFSQFATVKYLYLPYDDVNGQKKSKGYAFVEFGDKQAEKKLLFGIVGMDKSKKNNNGLGRGWTLEFLKSSGIFATIGGARSDSSNQKNAKANSSGQQQAKPPKSSQSGQNAPPKNARS